MYSFAKGIYIPNSLEHTIKLPSLSFMKSIIMTQILWTQESKDVVKRYKSLIPAKTLLYFGEKDPNKPTTQNQNIIVHLKH